MVVSDEVIVAMRVSIVSRSSVSEIT